MWEGRYEVMALRAMMEGSEISRFRFESSTTHRNLPVHAIPVALRNGGTKMSNSK